ncbi:MAG: LacI family DNA-binding transcriptional regulator [Planctomycetes bacterium]|nr:LacI family DNA-binding transcriptional regulator [Planctomycetota bacterium]
MSNIHDLAQAAGVSIATVSRAFNDNAKVKEETRQRILKLARELSYTPHTAARNLRRGREGRDQLNYCIGLVYSGNSIFNRSVFDITLAAHLEHHLNDIGFSLRLFQSPAEVQSIEHILNAPLDGIICTFANELTQRLAQHLPCLSLDSYAPLADVYGIMPDYRSGLYQATKYLLEHGHTDIIVCSESSQQSAFAHVGFSEMVHAGMLQAFQDVGLNLSPAAFAGSSNTVASGYRTCETILQRRMPDAIIASDQAMLGIYKSLNERGIVIGKDISLIGIDGMPDSAYLFPSLTSIDVHIPELAQKATSILNDWICNKNSKSGMELIPVDIIHRESVKV